MIACYCRVSSRRQKNDSQKAEITRWLRAHDAGTDRSGAHRAFGGECQSAYTLETRCSSCSWRRMYCSHNLFATFVSGRRYAITGLSCVLAARPVQFFSLRPLMGGSHLRLPMSGAGEPQVLLLGLPVRWQTISRCARLSLGSIPWKPATFNNERSAISQ